MRTCVSLLNFFQAGCCKVSKFVCAYCVQGHSQLSISFFFYCLSWCHWRTCTGLQWVIQGTLWGMFSSLFFFSFPCSTQHIGNIYLFMQVQCNGKFLGNRKFHKMASCWSDTSTPLSANLVFEVQPVLKKKDEKWRLLYPILGRPECEWLPQSMITLSICHCLLCDRYWKIKNMEWNCNPEKVGHAKWYFAIYGKVHLRCQEQEAFSIHVSAVTCLKRTLVKWGYFEK